MSKGTYTDTASREGMYSAALERSAAYALLVHGFTYPSEALISTAQRASGSLQRGADGAPGAVFGELCSLAAGAEVEQLESSYMRVFDPRNAPYPYESDHVVEHFAQGAELMADLMAFYKAFYFQPDAERPDHVVCELNFMHLVSLKEARALAQDRQEDVEVCRDARRKFLQSHLLGWYEAVVELIRQRADDREDQFYLTLASALELLMAQERNSLEWERN